MGLAFLLQTVYLLPITVVALAVILGALGFRARRRRGYGPLVFGLVASTLLLVGKFIVEVDIASYGRVALLIFASVWNSRPARPSKSNPIQIAIPSDGSRNQ
jgi:hypothetical protein